MEPSLVIKVQYGETLRRFSSHVVDGKLDIDMNGLIEKVCSLFNFSSGSELDFTYVDEDGDVVKLADEEDLHDILRQSLNPLRITVKLNTEWSVSSRPNGRTNGNSTPLRSPQLQFPLQVENAAVAEVLNSLPSTIRETTAKFSTELGLDTNSPAGYLAVLDSLAKMGLSYLKDVSVTGAKSGSTVISSTDATVGKEKNGSISVSTTPATEKKTSSISFRTTPATKDQTSSVPVQTTLVPELKGLGTDEGNAAEGFVMPALDNTNAKDESSILPKITATNLLNEMKGPSDFVSQENKVGKNGRSGPKMKPVKKSFESHHGWKSVMSPKPLTGIDSPSSGLPVPPYLHRHQLPYRVAPVRSYNKSDVMASVFHTGIQCDGCGVHPISGPRFKSKVKEDYDLCIFCFNHMGSEAEYIRMDLPMNYQGRDPLNFPFPHRLGRPPTLPADHAKLDSCFILDVNILDGTILTPLTHFTKIWRMRNNGAVAWPHGTKLLCIGGDKLSKTHSCDLKIPAEGFPVEKEIDVEVDFAAPENPGRYISYWRMASPSGQQFGQRVWVLIQVESSLKAPNSKNRDFNLNFPPVGSGIMGLQNENSSVDLKTGDDLTEIDASTKDQHAPVGRKISEDLIVIKKPTMDKGIDLNFWNNGTLLVARPKPDSAAPGASSTVTYPVVDQSKVEPVVISRQQKLDLDIPSSMIDANQGTAEVEQTLLKELENMGFTEIDLNKEILRKNKYHLEETLNELCDTEWDPILAELQEMGFSNNEMNKKLLKKNNGSIKRVVMDLIAGEEA